MDFTTALDIVRGLDDETATAVAVLVRGVSPLPVQAVGGKLDFFANLLTETDFSESALRPNELGALLHRYVVATERTAAALEWLTTLATGDAGRVRFAYAERLEVVSRGDIDEDDQRLYCQQCGTLLDDLDECAACFATAVVGVQS